MGTCASTSNVTEQTLLLSAEDQKKAYDAIFKIVVEMASEMLELEMVPRQALTPPADDIILGLVAVAAIHIASTQVGNPHGIVIVPGSGDNITKANCPPYLKSVVEPLINMKDELAKFNVSGELSTGDISRMKHFCLFMYSNTPEKIWGSAHQRYEQAIALARQVADATKTLPEFAVRSKTTAEEIDATVQNQVFEMNHNRHPGPMVNASNDLQLKDADDDGDDEDGSPKLPSPKAASPPAMAAPVPVAQSPPSPVNRDPPKPNHIAAIINEELEDVEDV